MVEVTFFDEADFLNKEEAFVALMNQGSLKFNQTASKWMKLKDFKCMKLGHDSPGKPELATKIYFVPNNEEPKKGINFKFSSFGSQGVDSTISCKRVIHQNPNLTSLIESRDTDMKRLKITYDEKTKYHCHELTPQFYNEIKLEYFYKAQAISCVYKLYKSKELVYLGETCDLKQTIKRHQDDNKKFDSVRFTILHNKENLRKYWEGFFLKKFKRENHGQLPKYNKLVPYPIAINHQKQTLIESKEVI